jgi:hypothetical protein
MAGFMREGLRRADSARGKPIGWRRIDPAAVGRIKRWPNAPGRWPTRCCPDIGKMNIANLDRKTLVANYIAEKSHDDRNQIKHTDRSKRITRPRSRVGTV